MVRSTAAYLALALVLGVALALPGSARAQQDAAEEDPEGRHTVERGESLWNLARRYYDDPFQWRRIYEANTDRIDDPHWIYPGQHFLIPGVGYVVVGVEVPGQPGPDAQPGAPGAPGPVAAAPAGLYPGPDDPTVFSQPPRTNIPTPNERTAFYGALSGTATVDERGGILTGSDVEHFEVSADVFYASPWLASRSGSESRLFPGEVSGWSGARSEARTRVDETMRPFDEIVIQWRDGSVPEQGDMLQLVRIERSERGLGRIVQPTALVRVVEPRDGEVVAVVTDAFRRPRNGNYAVPAPDFPLERGEYAVQSGGDVSVGLAGFARDRLIQQIGDIVFLSGGGMEGMAVGDAFAVQADGDGGGEEDVAYWVQVVRVEEDHATARITEVREAVFQPEAVARRMRRMP